jgi:hypothetical protein
MSTEVETIVKKLGLENARIQVGRERIFPPRNGLVVSPTAIEQFKMALSSPDAVKSTIKITEGETTKFWVSKGVVNVPLNPQIEEKAKTVMPALDDPEPVRLLTQTEQENIAARDTYFDLLKQHPDFKDLGVITREELLDRPTAIQHNGDRLVSEMALEQKLPREQFDRAIAQGSPYIEKELEAGSLSIVQGYLTERSVAYQHRLDAPTVTQEQTTQPVVDLPPSATAAPKEFDFPTDAVNHAAPVQGFAATVQTQLESAQVRALQAKDNLELAQKNLATFAQKVKHRGFKAWAKDQMPILKEKALEIAALQGTKLKDWAKEQGPVVAEVALKTAKQVGYEVAVTAEIVGAVGLAAGQVVVEAVVEKGKELGTKALEKLEKATQSVDPATLDPALKTLVAMYGKNGSFLGGEVDYRTERGRVNVYQKDGTPIYVAGKLNPTADRPYIDRLNRVAGNLRQVQALILQPPPVQHHQPREKAKGFAH